MARKSIGQPTPSNIGNALAEIIDTASNILGAIHNVSRKLDKLEREDSHNLKNVSSQVGYYLSAFEPVNGKVEVTRTDLEDWYKILTGTDHV